MIQINLQFETGAEARKALEELLGNSTQVVEHHIMDAIGYKKNAENFATSETKVSEVETSTKKRQAKAEKALEAAQPKIEETLAPTAGEDIQDDGINPETAPKEETASAVTAKMLQDKAVSVIRLGKKEEVTKLLEKFGAKSISQADKSPLKVEDYAAVMDELNKL